MTAPRAADRPSTSTRAAASRGPAALGLRALWIGIVAGPLLWSLHELVSYIVSSDVCEAGRGGARLAGVPAPNAVVLIASLVALPVTVYVLVRTVRWWRRDGTTPASTASVADERATFMLQFGAGIGTLAVIGLTFSAIAGFLLRCGWA